MTRAQPETLNTSDTVEHIRQATLTKTLSIGLQTHSFTKQTISCPFFMVCNPKRAAATATCLGHFIHRDAYWLITSRAFWNLIGLHCTLQREQALYQAFSSPEKAWLRQAKPSPPLYARDRCPPQGLYYEFVNELPATILHFYILCLGTAIIQTHSQLNCPIVN